MADSLDDFFAKKDKNKKTKKKNVTTDDIAKKLEDTGKRSDKMRKIKDKTNTNALITNINEQEDEEWNDFEEEREKDYSGLRIQTLTIKDKEEELREQQMQDMEEEKQKESASGPWKVSGAADDSDAEGGDEETAPETTSAVTVTPSGAQPTKYVPPHLRNQQMQTSISPIALNSTRKPKSGAPKIGDVLEFPSLGANESVEDTKGFQTVRHGSNRDRIERNSPNVTLDNKYGLLTNNKELQNND